MPYQGAGARHTVLDASKACVHGQIVSEDNGFVGSAFFVGQPDRFTRPEDYPKIAIHTEFEIQLGGVHEAPATVAGPLEDADVGDDVYIHDTDNALGLQADAIGALTQASLVTGTVGANNAIHWTAQEDSGTAGNAVRVQLRDPAGNSQALSVDSDGRDVIVSLATSAGGAITSTAAQVIAAVLEHDGASQLLTGANEGASTGAGVVLAVPLTALAGGSAAGLKAGWRKVGKVTEVDASRTPPVLRINGNGEVLAQVAG